MIDAQVRADREILRHAVCRMIFCEVSQRILDERTAVLFAGAGVVPRVMRGEVWDAHGPGVIAAARAVGAEPEVLDGRVLWA